MAVPMTLALAPAATLMPSPAITADAAEHVYAELSSSLQTLLWRPPPEAPLGDPLPYSATTIPPPF